MSTTTVKADLKDIASYLPETATYADAMYELYVRMKITQGKRAADEGRVVPHAEVKRRLAK